MRLGGQASSSFPFSRVVGALIEMEESCGPKAFLKEIEGELNVSPLSVCPTKERLGEKGASGFFPLKEGREERVEKEEEDVESWRYNCLAKFCHCLGMPTEGYESEILKLLHKMRERRDRCERISEKKEKRTETLEI